MCRYILEGKIVTSFSAASLACCVSTEICMGSWLKASTVSRPPECRMKCVLSILLIIAPVFPSLSFKHLILHVYRDPCKSCPYLKIWILFSFIQILELIEKSKQSKPLKEKVSVKAIIWKILEKNQHLLLMTLADFYRRFHLCISKGGGPSTLTLPELHVFGSFQRGIPLQYILKAEWFFYIYLPEQLIEYHLSLDFKTIQKNVSCLHDTIKYVSYWN